MADVDLGDEDDMLVRLVKSYPAYKSYARVCLESVPNADDLQVVMTFVITMAQRSGEEGRDEV